MSEALLDKPLPQEVLAVLPLEGHLQLELAHDIACHAYAQKVCSDPCTWCVACLWWCTSISGSPHVAYSGHDVVCCCCHAAAVVAPGLEA